MTLRTGLALLTVGLVSACAQATPPQPLTLPAADGRAAEIRPADGYRYLVDQQGLAGAQGAVYLRVTRAPAPELTYSDGLIAKRVAEDYCASFNRVLDPAAYGQFSTPASWIFEGGCR